LQLLELNIPMVLCLNMIDEAERKGIKIDTEGLSRRLGIPVVTTIGSKGVGMEELFKAAFDAKGEPLRRSTLRLSLHVEDKIAAIESTFTVKETRTRAFGKRLVAIKLLEGDPLFIKEFGQNNVLSQEHGAPADAVIAAERHNLAMRLFEQFAVIERPKQSWKDRIDNVLMHPFWGSLMMLLILFTYFNIIFKFGALLEQPLLNILDQALALVTRGLAPETLFYHLVDAAFQGISGGISIVLPYLVPFLIGLALIEDIGYLPRIAFLLDGFMHRIGLHGVAVIPGLLGYGCSVPAIMATRILASPRDRFIASVMAVLVPCSARMVVIMGLVGYYLGGTAAFGIYLFNLVVVTIIGAILARLLPDDSPGMILEMPSYHRPRVKVVFAKTWLRMRDFIVIAWPLLIVGSLVLGLAEWHHLDQFINQLTRPITFILDLPEQVGTTLIFGVLRKELSMLMLFQALGTQDVISVMTSSQILVFTLFVVFYIPCLATLGVMGREIGWKKTALVSAATLVLATVLALLGRVAALILF